MTRRLSQETIRSFRQAAKDIAKATKRLRQSDFPAGMRMIGEEIMTDIKASRPGHGVPVDEGTLRASGRVEGPLDLTRPQVWLSFGGAAAPYALKQHEVLTYHHTVGEPRYLVRGVERWRSTHSIAMRVLRARAGRTLKKKP